MSQSSEKSWQARIGKAAHALTVSFVESISFDQRLWRHDIAGSIAHAQMLAAVGLLTKADLRRIKAGFASIERDIRAGKLHFDPAKEDIHMVLEAALIDRIGEPGKKLHTARSRNDQIALDLRLYVRDAIDRQIVPALAGLEKSLVTMAAAETETVMPSYTHMQRAQPISLGAYLLAYVEQFDRDRQRFLDARKRVDVCPLGAGAVAGTTLPIDRRAVARSLGFAAVAGNSIDASSDRDFCVEFASCCAMTMMHLTRLAEDWIIYATQEFGFLRIDDAFCTGSSMMPQKRNPDLLELIRGKNGRAVGALMGLLAVMKGLPLAYNRDLQEDKIHVFAAHDTLAASLEVATAIVEHSRFDRRRLEAATRNGFLDATGLAEYLVGKGMPFRQAHQVVGRLVAECERNDKELPDLPIETLRAASDRIGPDVYRYLGARNVLARYRSEGSGGPASVRRQIARWRKALGK
jgi:argininosuccinate lyase